MTTEQPEALRIADALQDGTYLLSVERDATAAELRRLHAQNDQLRKAVSRLHTARGRFHTQLAACDLFDLLGLKNERPTK